MKELSIEEKAKRYDEAVERAKKVLLDCTPEEQKVVEYITPELTESEDEKIRIELLNYLWDVHDDDEERARWLAWLEKRDEQKDWANKLNDKIQELHKQCITQIKEQKPELKFDIPEIKIKDDVSVTSRVEHISEELKPIADFVIDYSHWNLHKDEWNHPVPEVPLFRVLDALVQEGKPYQGCISCVEQKPVKEHNICDTCDEKAGCVEPCPMKLIEQKPVDNKMPCNPDKCIYVQKYREKQKPVEWSGEDEKEIEEIIDILTQRPFIGTFFLQKHITWLDSLKDRVQPKQEWSEEDNQYLCGLIGLIEQSKAGLPITLKGKAADNCIDWLKSLRPQSQWKPSELDILLLERIANGKSNPQDFQASLYGLIGQLKKLKV